MIMMIAAKEEYTESTIRECSGGVMLTTRTMRDMCDMIKINITNIMKRADAHYTYIYRK